MVMQWVKSPFTLFVIPGLIKPAPYSIRGNPDVIPAEAGRHVYPRSRFSSGTLDSRWSLPRA
jgi:hypothetical protein